MDIIVPQSTPQEQPRKDFYTYRLIRSDTGLPFYVGKGCKERIKAHERNAGTHKDCTHRLCRTIRKLWNEGHKVIREKIAENITEASAFALERLYVSLGAIYGWDLVNHTNGGEGVSGYRWTEEQRKMRREVILREIALHPDRHARFVTSSKGRVHSHEEIQKRVQKAKVTFSDPRWKQQQSEATMKQWQDEEIRARRIAGHSTPEVRKKMGDRLRGKANDDLAKTYPGFVSPDGTIYKDVFNLHTFCQEHNLQISNMCEVASGKQYAHKGWRAYPLSEAPIKKPKPPKIPYTGFVSPDGQIYHVTSTLKAFCQEHGLTLGAMSHVNAGKWPSHKGWTKHNP